MTEEKFFIKYDWIALYIITFLISVIPGLFYTAPVFEDGLGTMATAAYLAGHDWSEFLAADGYYYKYGQSLWYIMPFMFINNAVLRYRVMLLINSLLTSFIPVIAYQITHTDELVDSKDAFLISLLTGLMPCILLNNKYTWAETNLMVIPWLILLFESRLFAEQEMAESKRRVYSAAVAVIAVFAFMSHQRGIIIVIATTIIVLLMKHWRKSSILLSYYFISLIIGLILDRFIASWQKEHVYAGALLIHNTLADFLKPEIYQKLFSTKGMGAVFKMFMGWLYNCSISTFGIAMVGIIYMIVVMISGFHRKRIESIQIIAGQGLLCFLGAFGLGLLFFFQSSYGYFDGTMVERSDHLLFGRYLESSIPILFYLGLIGIIRSHVVEKLFTLSYFIHCCLFAFVAVCLFPLMKNVDCYVHSLMAMNLFMDTSKITMTRDVVPNYVQALFMFGVLSLIVSLLIWLTYMRKRYITYVLIGVLFIWIYIWNIITVTGRVDVAHATKYAIYYLGTHLLP